MSEGAPAAPRVAGAAALTVAFTVALYWRTLHGGQLSDDLVLATALSRPGPPGAVDWPAVGRCFTQPWLLGGGALFRPLAAVVHAASWELAGLPGLRAVNLAVLALAVASCAVFAGVLGRSAAAAAIAGIVVAAHPAAHELACWPCAQSETLMLLCASAAATAFVQALRGRGRAWSWLAGAATCLCLLARETALLLPLLFVLLDLRERGRRGALAGSRPRLHLAWLVPWLAYWLLRRIALGQWFGGLIGARLDEAHWPHLAVASKFAGMLVPSDALFPPWATVATAAGLTLAIAAAFRARLMLSALLWLAASWVATPLFPMGPALFNGRVLVQGVAALGVAIGVGAASVRGRRRAAAAAALAVAVAGMTTISDCAVRRYEASWQLMRELRSQLDGVSRSATVERPLALALVEPATPPPFLEPFYAFPLLETPAAAADVPFVSLACAVMSVPLAGELVYDMAPLRALWHHGATLCYWTAANGMTTVPPAAAPPTWRRLGGGRFDVGSAVAAWDVETFTVGAPTPFGEGRLVYCGSAGDLGALRVPAGSRRDDAFAAEVDASHDLGFVAGTLGGGIASVRLEVEGADVDSFELGSHGRVQELRLAHALAGRTVPLSRLSELLPPPTLPEGHDGRLVLVLMNGSCQQAVPHGPRGLEPSAATLHVLRQHVRLAHQDLQWCYWELRTPERSWRSAVDWFVLVDDR